MLRTSGASPPLFFGVSLYMITLLTRCQRVMLWGASGASGEQIFSIGCEVIERRRRGRKRKEEVPYSPAQSLESAMYIPNPWAEV